MVHLIKLYASPDRGTRMALLDHLQDYADKLDKKTVTDKIWPNLVRLIPLYSRASDHKVHYSKQGLTIPFLLYVKLLSGQ